MVSECLFSLIKGDDMFATFKKMQQKSYLQQQLDGNPMSELQAFISEYKDHPNSGSYTCGGSDRLPACSAAPGGEIFSLMRRRR
ncbi:hypothetical protein KOW79_018738 [Hemibagrus wyckioides]|uniref:Uncharacterized protein n=1 Tax=Hemibagrus wyckioides TaxID=337641 RepID=A0A9D3SFG0_9TELE|nr:hypothetical protein KOW79_018738 [Hemibagrus wyckioides]